MQNPDWFIKEAMEIRKLSLELELARHEEEKWKGFREERRNKFDSRRSVGLPFLWSLSILTRVADQDHQEGLCSPEVHPQEARRGSRCRGSRCRDSCWRCSSCR